MTGRPIARRAVVYACFRPPAFPARELWPSSSSRLTLLDNRVSLAGKTIGNYKVVQQIGEGGMGVVYLAEHPVIGRKVAIKLLHNSFAKDSETVARFFNEARAIHLIAHPNIVEILDFGQTTEGQPYFIMEYLSGESLAERIARGPVPPDEAVTIVSQICDALQAAHDKKIVHRDLKPHNVYLLDHSGRQIVKILDFGVAKMSTGWDAAQSGGQSVKTRTGSLMGTPLYMSPEQCRGFGKARPPHRHLFAGGDLVRDDFQAPAFRCGGCGRAVRQAHAGARAVTGGIRARDPAPHRPRRGARAVQGSRRSICRHERVSRRSARPARRRGFAGGTPATGGSGAQGTPGPRPHQSAQDRELPPEQTTLSSMVSELEGGELNGFPTRSRKGLLIGIALAATAVLAGVMVLRKNRTAAVANVSAAPSPATETAPAPVSTPSLSTPAPAATESVTITFQAEPAGTHLLRKKPDSRELEDVGDVPLELKLPRGTTATEYVLRAENHKDRAVTVEPSRDQVVHLALERESSSAAEKERDRRARPTSSRPAKPKRPVIEDGDGLAVPSF